MYHAPLGAQRSSVVMYFDPCPVAKPHIIKNHHQSYAHRFYLTIHPSLTSSPTSPPTPNPLFLYTSLLPPQTLSLPSLTQKTTREGRPVRTPRYGSFGHPVMSEPPRPPSNYTLNFLLTTSYQKHYLHRASGTKIPRICDTATRSV